jgi:hypothetical protein
MAITYVKNNATWRTAKTPGTWVSNQALGGGAFTIDGRDGADTNGDGVIDGGNSDFNDARHPLTLTSTGTYKGATYAVKSVLTPTGSTITVGMIALATSGTTVTMNKYAVIDSYDSSLGAYGGSNVGSAATVTTNSPADSTVTVGADARLAGNVTAGPGANTTLAVSVSGGTYTGTTTAQTQATPTPTIVVPDLGPAGGALNYPSGAEGTLGTNLHCASVNLQTDAKLTITGNVIIVSDGNFIMNTGAKLTVNPGCSLKVYCKGSLNMNTSADNRPTGQDNSRLTFYNLGTSDVVFNTGGSFQGVLIAPNAAVKLNTGFQLFGAVIAKSLSLNTGCAVHQDLRITNGIDAVGIPGAVSNYRVKWLANY